MLFHSPRLCFTATSGTCQCGAVAALTNVAQAASRAGVAIFKARGHHKPRKKEEARRAHNSPRSCITVPQRLKDGRGGAAQSQASYVASVRLPLSTCTVPGARVSSGREEWLGRASSSACAASVCAHAPCGGGGACARRAAGAYSTPRRRLKSSTIIVRPSRSTTCAHGATQRAPALSAC